MTTTRAHEAFIQGLLENSGIFPRYLMMLMTCLNHQLHYIVLPASKDSLRLYHFY